MAFWKRKRPSPAPLGVGPSGGKLGGRSERVNEWPRCGKGCWKRVPAALVHKRCVRACRELQTPSLRIPVTHNGGHWCCPGWCRVCQKCWDEPHIDCNNCGRCVQECPGICDECGNCLDKCTCRKEDEK